MTPKRRRMIWLLAGAVVACAGAALILSSFSRHLVYFYTPTQLQSESPPVQREFRLGGLVKRGSVEQTGRESIRFVITDLTHSFPATYRGTLPGLFREGQGVVAQGTLNTEGTFVARTILAKHDENYMPPEVVEALKASGRWRHYSPENVETFSPGPSPESRQEP